LNTRWIREVHLVLELIAKEAINSTMNLHAYTTMVI
jgi:hypothetical protein